MIVTSFPRAVREIEHTTIPLKDGTRLAARIWLPEDAEANPVPALKWKAPRTVHECVSSDVAPSAIEVEVSSCEMAANPGAAAECSSDPIQCPLDDAHISREATQCSSDAALDARVLKHHFQANGTPMPPRGTPFPGRDARCKVTRRAFPASRRAFPGLRSTMPGVAAFVSNLASRCPNRPAADARWPDSRCQVIGTLMPESYRPAQKSRPRDQLRAIR